MNQDTYTTTEAMKALGLTARSAFHHLRHKYPQAFVVVQSGAGRSHETTYDKSELDGFIKWRQMLKTYTRYQDILTAYSQPTSIDNAFAALNPQPSELAKALKKGRKS